ncbi:MAG TPA: hypothetical protein VMA96_01795 [Solirubrobacteraceae bacterium]|nr:hypothetical protein [Solirubrobacteraceae bacterium]
MSTRQHDPAPARPAPTRTRSRKRPELVEIGIRLLDEAHVAWQRAELECENALRAWREGPPRASVDRYLSYREALDREQVAAQDLQRLWELARAGHDAFVAAASTPAGERPS